MPPLHRAPCAGRSVTEGRWTFSPALCTQPCPVKDSGCQLTLRRRGLNLATALSRRQAVCGFGAVKRAPVSGSVSGFHRTMQITFPFPGKEAGIAPPAGEHGNPCASQIPSSFQGAAASWLWGWLCLPAGPASCSRIVPPSPPPAGAGPRVPSRSSLKVRIARKPQGFSGEPQNFRTSASPFCLSEKWRPR